MPISECRLRIGKSVAGCLLLVAGEKMVSCGDVYALWVQRHRENITSYLNLYFLIPKILLIMSEKNSKISPFGY